MSDTKQDQDPKQSGKKPLKPEDLGGVSGGMPISSGGTRETPIKFTGDEVDGD
jgi:hypothetical protein